MRRTGRTRPRVDLDGLDGVGQPQRHLALRVTHTAEEEAAAFGVFLAPQHHVQLTLRTRAVPGRPTFGEDGCLARLRGPSRPTVQLLFFSSMNYGIPHTLQRSNSIHSERGYKKNRRRTRER